MGKSFSIFESLPSRQKVPRAGRVCRPSASRFHQWQVLWRDLRSSSATEFTLGLGAGCCVWASPWSQWTLSVSLRAVAGSASVCAAYRLPGLLLCIPTLCWMNHSSSGRPQWYGKAVLSPCSICFSGISATAGVHGRHLSHDRAYETTSISESKYG